MDWNAAIEKNREALKRVLAMLVAMARLDASALTSPLWGGRREASGGGSDAADTPTRRSDDRRPPHKGEVKPEFTLPRHLHRAVLSLLRPAEAAARRLIMVAARGIVVAVPPARQREPSPTSTFLRNGIGTGIVMPHCFRPMTGLSPPAAQPCLAVVRPAAALERPRAAGGERVSPHLHPRSDPAVSRPPRALARRPARRDPPYAAPPGARRGTGRPAATSQALRALAGEGGGCRAQAQRHRRAKRHSRAAGRFRRVWPLRPGRPPGGRLAHYDPDAPRRKKIRDVDEILAHAHALARYALSPDTS